MSITDECELINWRAYASRISQAINDHLASKGDSADSDLIQLQHDVALLANRSIHSKEALPL